MSAWLVATPTDGVATALVALEPGSEFPGGRVRDPIPAGHKVALRDHGAGEPVVKLGHPIGVATRAIAAGEHVHVHNLAPVIRERRIARAAVAAPAPRRASFPGYPRPDGRVGTRNHVGILATVNCAATVARRIAAAFTPERLAAWPGVDGVSAYTHRSGCGLEAGGVGLATLRRTLAGYLAHPNFGAVLLVGLGCEVNQARDLLAAAGLEPGPTLQVLGIQEGGGTLAAIESGIAAVEAMLPIAAAARRSPVDARHLVVGLQCGGSDGLSALTANPALGIAADAVVACGGRVVLAETPEIFGAEGLLLERASDAAVAERLLAALGRWEQEARRRGTDLDANPSPGNRAGGITTIIEKSLGAVAKAGRSPLVDVVDYGAPVSVPGLTFMDTPGYDPCSATGQIAGGANLIVFTTGRGAVFGSKPAPTLKLASNDALARRQAADIDVNCGGIASGAARVETVGEAVFEAMLAAAGGRRTASEIAGLGDEEFVPWVPDMTF